MKKKYYFLLVFSLLLMLVPGININATTKKITLSSGSCYQLKTRKKAKWSSSNKKIVSVSKKGKVKAKKIGSATIKAKTNKKTYKFKIRVENPYINHTQITLMEGDHKKLKLVANTQKVSWSSLDSQIASVNKNGTVSAKKEGATRIRAKILKKTFTCTVTVKKPLADSLSVSGIPTRTLMEGESFTLSTKISPKNAKQEIVWYSSDPSVAEVKQGMVFCKKSGSFTIEAKTTDHSGLVWKKTFHVREKIHPDSISIQSAEDPA